MKKKIYTSLEVNDLDFKIVQGFGNGTVESLRLLHVHPTASESEEEITQAVLKTLKKASWNPQEFVVSIPRRFFILKHLTLPSKFPDELRKMISLQILGYVPYQENEFGWDYIVLEEMPSGHTRVLVMVVNREVLGRYVKMLSFLKIRPKKLTMSSFGLWGWHSLHEEFLKSKDDCVQLVISPDRSHSEICFCDRRKFYFSRSLSFGIKEFEVQRISQLISEISLTLSAYRKERMGPEPLKVKILSSSSVVEGLREEMFKEICLPISIYDPLKEFPKESLLKFSLTDEALQSSFTVGLGLIAMDAKKASDFLPPKGQRGVGGSSKIVKRLGSFIFFLLAYLSVVMVFGLNAYKESRALSWIEGQRAQLRPRLKGAEQRIREWNSLKKEIKNEKPVLQTIEELYRWTPPEVTFSILRIQSQGEVTLEGVSLTGTGVNQLQSNLVGSTLFKSVALQQATKRTSSVGEVTHFLMSARLDSGS